MSVPYCARCSKPLKDDEAKEIDVAPPTGAGTKITVCLNYFLCKPPPTQTAPYSRRY
ncbi:hypothetical protein ACIGPN_16885 [Streptomyces afghaniensis]|uniref:hypothetical protein n=1 Tax=Streptomyces TaxID=1883 RepID=UPI001FAFE429|nr:hypothetical protein [Streptomyces sp. HP-A2021]UOB11874.1 hypothetical protein MQE23_23660 [Streptomyces sp. HP-A2021]